MPEDIMCVACGNLDKSNLVFYKNARVVYCKLCSAYTAYSPHITQVLETDDDGMEEVHG